MIIYNNAGGQIIKKTKLFHKEERTLEISGDHGWSKIITLDV